MAEANFPPGLDAAKIPAHIAVIMDGNGRWAAERGLPRTAGHRAGVKSVEEVTRACSDIGVKVLTLYAFSSENWRRPRLEVAALMRLLAATLRGKRGLFEENNIRLRACGRISEMPSSVRNELEASKKALAKNDGMILNLALNYGGRQEIADAANSLLASGAKTIDEESLSSRLYTAGLPDPDLVIRTSGERRLSNFLLWQSAYAELYFASAHWPDFGREELFEAVRDYQSRQRRFGGV